MKNNIITSLVLFVLTIFCSLLIGCTERALNPPFTEGKISITFNWKNVPQGDPIPTKMNLCFYNSDGKVVNKECSAKDGYNGVIPNGTYKILAYNPEAQNAEFGSLESFETAKVTIPLLPGNQYLAQPNQIYVATLTNFTANAVDNGSFVMIPDYLSKKAVLKMVITGNKDLVASSVVTLSGITKSMNLTSNELLPGSGTVTFVPKPDNTGFESVFNLLGKDVSSPNMVNVTFDFKDGSKQNMDPIDISASMADVNKYSNSFVVVNVVFNIEIVGSEQAGFTAKLKNWYPDYRDVTVI